MLKKNRMKWSGFGIIFILLYGCVNATSTPPIHSFRYAIADLTDQVVPVVVSIQTEATTKRTPQMDMWERFFFGPQAPQGDLPKQRGLGSGVIISAKGYIITNNHVIENAEQIRVTLSDKREFKAKIVGTDPQSDVAVIQLTDPPKDLPTAKLGKSSPLRVGEWIIAVGSPFGLDHTVTTGIVSAKGVHNRGLNTYENFIQTDAAINPGNSGGGLFNLDGELIGINTAILSRTGGFQGIGFAIPVDLAFMVYEDLITDGKVSRGWLGVSIQDVTPVIAKALKLERPQGALVSDVFEKSPAQKAGIKSGDLIIEVDGQSIVDANALRHEVAKARPGSKVKMVVIRDGDKKTISVKLASRENGLEYAEASSQGKGFSGELGMSVEQEEGADGVVVQSIQPDGAAASAGIRVGDVVLRIGDRRTNSLKAFREALRKVGKAKTVLMLIQRGTGRYFIAVER